MNCPLTLHALEVSTSVNAIILFHYQEIPTIQETEDGPVYLISEDFSIYFTIQFHLTWHQMHALIEKDRKIFS